MTLLLTGGQVVTEATVLPGGWVLVVDGLIADVGAAGAEPVADEMIDLGGRLLLPGLIDLHVHGAAGATFDDGPHSIAAGLAAHRRCGTTRSLVSLVTAPLPVLTQRIADAATYVATDRQVLGLHLEGPFLSELRRGVHDPAALIDPQPQSVQQLLDAGGGSVRVITIAPELPGGVAAVRQITQAGVHAAVGHSDADYATAATAFQAGADLVTHAFNGMRPLHHRDPAIIGAAMDAGVTIEAINDGIHLHPSTMRLLRSIAPGKLALITDAMAAARHGDGRYSLAGFEVEVAGGVARLVSDDPAVPGSIAGSTLTMDIAVQRAVEVIGLSVVDAVAAASAVPAALLGVADRFGSIAAGKVADLVVMDQQWVVQAVLVDGQWADERRP